MEKSTRPARVGNAVALLYATIGIGVFRAVLEFSTMASAATVALILLTWFIAFGLMALLVYKIGAGRNWARLTFLVLFLIGVPLVILPLLQSLSAVPISGVLGIAQFAGQAAALGMLFAEPAATWFRQPTAG